MRVMMAARHALLLALAAPLLAGCVGDAYDAVLRIDFGDLRRPIETEVRVDPDVFPAAARFAKDGATHPGYYTAFDLLEQGRRTAVYTYNATYYPTYGNYLLDTVNHVPGKVDNAFWSLSRNGEDAMEGMGTLRVEPGDRITFTLTPFEPMTT